MQWLAMLTMLIDHIGVVWFPDTHELRMIGRLAFPIYTYFIVIGYHRTRNFNRYAIRLSILAVISQIPFQLALNTTHINVIATLFICLLALKLLDATRVHIIVKMLFLLGTLVLLEALSFDYGAYALLLMLIYRYAPTSKMIFIHLALEFIFIFYKGWAYQYLSVTITAFICYFRSFMDSLDQLQVPRWLWRSFYPAHLLIIAIAQFVIIY